MACSFLLLILMKNFFGAVKWVKNFVQNRQFWVGYIFLRCVFFSVF